MEDSHKEAILQPLLQNSTHTPSFWINIPQWRRSGIENNIQGAPNNPLPMNLSQLLPPRQKERVPVKTRHEKYDGQDQKDPSVCIELQTEGL